MCVCVHTMWTHQTVWPVCVRETTLVRSGSWGNAQSNQCRSVDLAERGGQVKKDDPQWKSMERTKPYIFGRRERVLYCWKCTQRTRTGNLSESWVLLMEMSDIQRRQTVLTCHESISMFPIWNTVEGRLPWHRHCAYNVLGYIKLAGRSYIHTEG